MQQHCALPCQAQVVRTDDMNEQDGKLDDLLGVALCEPLDEQINKV